MTGRLEVICGPMYSGKTEELIRRLHRARFAKKNVVAFKPAMENRYGETQVVSHNGFSIPCYTIEDPLDIITLSNGYDVIGIDEAQFFDDRLKFPVSLLSISRQLILTGLDTTYRGEPWDNFPYYMAIAEKLDKLSAVCVICGEEATRTQRLTDGKPALFDEQTISVGGKDKYEARCRVCFQGGSDV